MAISLGAAHAQEFYKDKTITFIVGYSPGGIYDQYTRLIARHISKYIPGQPNTIVENMTGAGGIIAANHLYNRAKPDGLTVAAWASPLILQQIMGNEATKFDARKVGWVVPVTFTRLNFPALLRKVNTISVGVLEPDIFVRTL